MHAGLTVETLSIDLWVSQVEDLSSASDSYSLPDSAFHFHRLYSDLMDKVCIDLESMGDTYVEQRQIPHTDLH